MAKRSLDLAVSNITPSLPESLILQMEYERRPFCLRPERRGFLPWREILADLGKSRGNPNWVGQFIPSMEVRGRSVGIIFNFDVELGNSLGSLRLLWWVKEQHGLAKQEELAGSLATLHFEQKNCVSRRETLLKACEKIGITGADKIIDDESAFMQEVLADIEKSHTEGFYSIPVFIFQVSNDSIFSKQEPQQQKQNQWVIQGAASVSEFEELLLEIAAANV